MALSLLVLTDFTHPADHALAYADRLASAIGGRLVLLHVRRDAILDPEQLSGTLADLDTEATQLAFASLQRGLVAPAVAETGHGGVAEAVAQAVRQHQPTLIVLGRTPAGNTPDELLAPLALALLRSAPYPMLVVPNLPLAAAAPRRVLLAVDGESFSLGAYAGAMRNLLDALSAVIVVLHVLPPGSTEEYPDQPLEWVERTGLAGDLALLTRHRRVSAETPAEGILRVAGSGEFDLVALIARPRSFLGRLFHRSVTAQVLLHSPIPVLVLPAVE
jgi:nucleotide-binding universal stress UspA family protein